MSAGKEPLKLAVTILLLFVAVDFVAVDATPHREKGVRLTFVPVKV